MKGKAHHRRQFTVTDAAIRQRASDDLTRSAFNEMAPETLLQVLELMMTGRDAEASALIEADVRAHEAAIRSGAKAIGARELRTCLHCQGMAELLEPAFAEDPLPNPAPYRCAHCGHRFTVPTI